VEWTSASYDCVLRRCQAILRDRSDAEDAAQEVFARAAAAGRQDAPSDWLIGVANHVCMDEFRRRARLRRALDRAGAGGPGADQDPEPAVIGSVLLDQLLPRLSSAEARVLNHRLATGATLEETAIDLGLAGSTVRTLAARIRQKLRPFVPAPAWRGRVPARLPRPGPSGWWRRWCSPPWWR